MYIFENACPQDLLDAIHEDLDRVLSIPSHPVLNTAHWEPSLLVGIEGTTVMIKIENHINRMMRKFLISKVPETYFYNMSFSYQIMSYKSGIAAHSDGNKKFAMSLYLNKHWDLNYGGLLVYQDGNDLKAICPKYNLMTVNTAKHLHLVTAVTNAAPEKRISIQCFGG